VIVDASALLAIVLGEADARRYAEAIAEADRPAMSSATWFEAAIVVEGRGDPVAIGHFDDFLARFGIGMVSFTPAHAARARQAWLRFGKGRHRAGLNFGDCMAYATAKEAHAPLLFKGNDFPHTDIEPALKD